MRDVDSRGRTTTLLTTVHIMEETMTDSDMVQFDMIRRNEGIVC